MIEIVNFYDKVYIGSEIKVGLSIYPNIMALNSLYERNWGCKEILNIYSQIVHVYAIPIKFVPFNQTDCKYVGWVYFFSIGLCVEFCF